MKLELINMDNIYLASIKTPVKVKGYKCDEDTYTFVLRHRNYTGEFRYTILREFNDKKFVGTFAHPYGSYRYDCYEMDLLDKQSFLYVLDIMIKEWAIKYKVTC
jgi:hypothetical protein